jgi:two-component system, response regulator PdtaR
MARILVVEDDVLLRYSLCAWLRNRGNDVTEAATGDEAKTILSSLAEVDLVVTDMQMPGATDGASLARYIRSAFPALPVIIVSGNASSPAATDAAAFFRKPYDLDAVSACIATLLPRRSDMLQPAKDRAHGS